MKMHLTSVAAALFPLARAGAVAPQDVVITPQEDTEVRE
jgi:hypothetical protein